MGELEDAVYLGLDLSTQSVSSLAINSDGKVVHRETVNFDSELPAYGTTNGMTVKGDSVVTSPAGMWLEGLDLLFSRIDKSVLARIKAISASAQQHGSVYWGSTGQASLQSLDPARSLKDNVLSALVFTDCPIWADSSTEEQCARLEKALGGAQAVADATGSRAYPRFTGNQIAKIAQQEATRKEWEGCCRVSLVSSFVSSLLIGDYAPIDYSDGSGMNLLHLRAKRWHLPACHASAPRLVEKLGSEPVPSSTVLGRVCGYWAEKHGVARTCKVVCCSGDNPNAIVGLQLQPAEIAISLGTSDTLMGISYTPSPTLDGHLMVHPTISDAYFAMLVYKNGAVAREAVRDAECKGSWTEFEARLAESEAGNGGKLLLRVHMHEITPRIVAKGVHREDEHGVVVSHGFSPAEEVRGVVESRLLSLRLHAHAMGLAVPPERVVLTGGSAQNRQVCQVVADVFGSTVEVHAEAESDTAALGAALRAQEAVRGAQGQRTPETDSAAGAARANKRQRRELKVVATPDPKATATYTALLERFAAFESRLAALPPTPDAE